MDWIFQNIIFLVFLWFYDLGQLKNIENEIENIDLKAIIVRKN